MGLPIIGEVLELVNNGIDKIWPDAATKEKAKIEMQGLILNQAMADKKLLFQDTEGARKVFIEELRAQSVPKWTRAIQVLGRQFALYATVGMYIYSKGCVHLGKLLSWMFGSTVDLPEIVLHQRDYYLIGTVFVFLFGARSVEKMFGKQ